MYLDVIPRKPLQWRYLVFRAPRIERKTSEEGAKEVRRGIEDPIESSLKSARSHGQSLD